MIVKFFPKKTNIPASICDHRYDADMTFSEQTDSRFLPSIYVVEAYGFKNNVRLGAFQSNLVPQTDEGISSAEVTGLIRHDIYFSTDRWKSPNTNAIEQIPDYYLETWTENGVATFANAVLGDPKSVRYPNVGQEMYDLSNGSLGYDFSTGTKGLSNLSEFLGIVNSQQEWLQMLTGRRAISGISYRNGREETSGLQYPYFLGGRNSTAGPAKGNGDSQTYYGVSKDGNGELGYRGSLPAGREYFISYQSTSRFWDWEFTYYIPPLTHQQVNDYVLQELAKCVASKGWFRDFTHWHEAFNSGTSNLIDDFLALIRANTGFIHTCSNGEALEYLFLRELASRVRASEKDGKVIIVIDVDDKYKGGVVDGVELNTPLNQLNTPLSVRVDLTGTVLEGKNIVSSAGRIKNNGDNVFVIEVPFISDKEGFASVELSEGDDGYLNFSIPDISFQIIGGTVKIISNQDVKSVLFKGVINGSLEDIESVERSNINKMNHSFDFDPGYSYWAGVINDAGMANLLKIN